MFINTVASVSVLGTALVVFSGLGPAVATATQPEVSSPIFTAPAARSVPQHLSISTPHTFGRPALPGSAYAGRTDTNGRAITLLEIAAEPVLVGMRQRPHHALGFRSSTTEHWLRGQGIDAAHCYLPMLRLHTKVDPSGSFQGAFWIYARCAFQ